MTMSCLRSSFGPGASSAVIRTDAMRASLNLIPMKDRLASPGEAGTETAEYPLTVAIEILDRACWPCVGCPSIWLVNVCEDRAEASDRCWRSPIGPGDEEQTFGDVAAHRSEQPRRAEGGEDGGVGRVIEEHGQSPGPMGEPAKGPVPGVVNWAPRVFRNTLNGVTGGCRVHDGGVTAIPVDFAATGRERPRVIAVIGISQSSAEGIDRALNRGSSWPGCLEHSRRHEAIGQVALCVRSLANWK